MSWTPTGAAVLALLMTSCAATPGADAPQSGAAPSDAAATPLIEVMVLGTFHMAGSTADVVNMKVDDVLAPRRQAELEALADALLEFRPTAVAVERIVDDPSYVDARYAAFTPESLAAVRNEREQIGYRVARRAGLAAVYGVDEQATEGEPDYFPLGAVMAAAERQGRSAKLEAVIAGVQSFVAEIERRQATSSIPGVLAYLNGGGGDDASFYYGLFAFDAGEDQPGSELQAYWFMRNAKIFSKIAQVTRPGDRVLVVYGAGHKHWLEHFADNTPGFARVDPAPYLARAVAALD